VDLGLHRVQQGERPVGRAAREPAGLVLSRAECLSEPLSDIVGRLSKVGIEHLLRVMT
jgi:hypothetical protein